MNDQERRKRQNLRLALILASVALVFFVGFIVRMVFFGG
ncbi:cytochrome oxidase small assembly protein [Caldimonas tepidiphila]|nr:cytochrome oxidase small assembly protein [Caldimonas tepidiphila]